jgi:hypothetical protein
MIRSAANEEASRVRLKCTHLIEAYRGRYRRALTDSPSSREKCTYNDYVGRPLTVLQDVYKSESDSNQRNQAIGALMLAYGYIKSNWPQAVDLYTRQCSVGVNAKDLAHGPACEERRRRWHPRRLPRQVRHRRRVAIA